MKAWPLAAGPPYYLLREAPGLLAQDTRRTSLPIVSFDSCRRLTLETFANRRVNTDRLGRGAANNRSDREEWEGWRGQSARTQDAMEENTASPGGRKSFFGAVC